MGGLVRLRGGVEEFSVYGCCFYKVSKILV